MYSLQTHLDISTILLWSSTSSIPSSTNSHIHVLTILENLGKFTAKGQIRTTKLQSTSGVPHNGLALWCWICVIWSGSLNAKWRNWVMICPKSLSYFSCTLFKWGIGSHVIKFWVVYWSTLMKFKFHYNWIVSWL